MLSDPKTMVSYYNPALSMFPPGHHHHHSSSAHTATAAAAAAARHSPAATSAAAAAAAQASSYFPAAAAATYGYPHQQFASPYANLSDLNSNMYPGFSSSFDHSAPAAAAAAAAPSWPSAQWAASAGAFASPTSAATVAACRSAYVDSWQTTAADVHPQESSSNNDGGGSGGGGGVTSNHSPGNENNVTSSSAAPAAPTASAAADSPSFANSQSSGSPTGTPTPTYNGGDQQSEMVFSKVFDSPSYVNKLDQQLSSSNSPSHFGLPPSITVTPGGNGSGGLMAAAAAAAAGGDALALSPPTAGSLSPSSNPIQTSGRPQPARSPYEWMKKPSYQSQPEKNGKRARNMCVLGMFFCLFGKVTHVFSISPLNVIFFSGQFWQDVTFFSILAQIPFYCREPEKSGVRNASHIFAGKFLRAILARCDN